MSSRFGPRAAGTDGTDFKHRQRVAAQYQTSVSYKMYLKTLFLAHFLVLFVMWIKVFGQNFLDAAGIKSPRFKKLDLPTAYPWEYVWCTSIIPVIMALLALPKNNSKLMRTAYYGQFFSGILPLCIGLGSQFPELIDYIRDPSRTDIPTVKGSFPMVVIWFIFFLISFQLHIFAMYFEYYLLAAWDPVVEKSDDGIEDSTTNEKDKDEASPVARSATFNRKARKAD
ncbi:hypothetical protein FO519_007738 [Halicephalobus sp. NKZ332]|nr:hypothetical protein FO519_007738 [Halicephalobus sp. NKZ332]